MKKQILPLILGLLLILGAGCSKFEPATVDLSVTPISLENSYILDCKGAVTNNGGCKYFNEMGFLFSLTPEPTYKGQDVTTLVAEEDIEETKFDMTYQAPLLDTVYYVRAYVCTNAGTGYSDVQIVSTHLE